MFAVIQNDIVILANSVDFKPAELVIETPKVKIENGLLEIIGMLRTYKFNGGYIKPEEVDIQNISWTKIGKPFVRRGWVFLKDKQLVKITKSNFMLIEEIDGRK